jgi:aminoglycoside 3-N-acetyltransferase
MNYSFEDIRDSYKSVGVSKGRVVSLKTDLRLLGRFEKPGKDDVLRAHFDALADLIDLGKGTLVVSTATTSLCNTQTPFNMEETPSEVGILTEYIRRMDDSLRSFHAFESYAAIGEDAEAICFDVARHAYGPETPEDRLVQSDALCVSIGLPPRLTCSTVHHVEMMMGVPYRYTKEYSHPVVSDGAVKEECFYRYVWYRQCDIKRNENMKVFDHFDSEGYKTDISTLGKGKVYSYSLSDFYRSTVKLFKEDIYAWLDEVPAAKPYLE